MVFARSPLAAPTGSVAAFPRISFTRLTPARVACLTKRILRRRLLRRPDAESYVSALSPGKTPSFRPSSGTTVDGGVHWSFHPFYFNGNEGNCDDVFFFDNITGVTSGVLFDGTGAIARTANGGTDWNSTLFSARHAGNRFPETGGRFRRWLRRHHFRSTTTATPGRRRRAAPSSISLTFILPAMA